MPQPTQLYLLPAVPGSLVRDPVTLEPLPAAGTLKPETTYWLRRLRDGDVVRDLVRELAAPLGPPPETAATMELAPGAEKQEELPDELEPARRKKPRTNPQ